VSWWTDIRDSIGDRIKREWEKLLEKITGVKTDKPKPPPSGTPAEPTDPGAWRSDMAEVKAVDGVVTFRTRNIQRPPGANKDGGMEWIIALAFGHGFTRVLLMTMGGNRPPSRIHCQTPHEERHTNANVFEVPLAREATWRIVGKGGALSIELDGREISRIDGQFTINGAIMQGYANRGFLGEWQP
jgi:hypothetical protein